MLYRLYAVLHHSHAGYGGIGHYHCATRNAGSQEWCCYDDRAVYAMPHSEMALAVGTSYVFCYERELSVSQ